ncbi:MAG: L,D-transpeptidase family protein [Pseudomonadota bacterium]|nr:L,D-transpeptidase family protein [Pseudomonadota bacterium]
MKQITHPLRFAAIAALASLGTTSSIASEQPTAAEAAAAADEAQEIAREAEDAIRAFDPATGGPSLVVDPSLPQPYGVDVAPTNRIESLPAPKPKLPEIGESLPVVGSGTAPARGPATRMISRPQVQALPAPDPITPPPSARVANKAPVKADPFTLKSILTIPEGPFRYGDWYWDESNAPAKGKLVMTVDLDARVISVFRDGHEIGTAVALLGTRKHPTPLGTFPILTKEKDNVSEKYNNAPMPWTLRLTWDGIAIHGSEVINGYASHGCIGVPNEFAEKLFAIAGRGDKVVITRGKMIGVGDKIS